MMKRAIKDSLFRNIFKEKNIQWVALFGDVVSAIEL